MMPLYSRNTLGQGRAPALGPSADTNPCVVTHTKTASPSVLRLGEEMTITLGVRVTCPSLPGDLHIVLVLDGSSTMDGERGREMKRAASKLVRDLDLPNRPGRRVGVVEFNDKAGILCALTSDEEDVVACIDQIGASGGTRIDLGLHEGNRALRRGRSVADRDGLWETIILLTDGSMDNDPGCEVSCEILLKVSEAIKDVGRHLVTACFGPHCDRQCVRGMASNPRYYHQAVAPDELGASFDAIGRQLLDTVPVHMKVTDAWGDRSVFVGGSASPMQTAPFLPGDTLWWEEPAVPGSGVTYSLRLRPLRAGRQATNVTAVGELRNQSSVELLTWEFSVPYVTVVDGSPLYVPRALRRE